MSAGAISVSLAALAAAGVVLRPFGWAEAVWAVLGAIGLVVTGVLTPAEAAQGLGRGADVYLFLVGMMLLAEIAREEGLFAWLAAHAAHAAKRSASRLFALVYLVGVLVTVFLSNDATAVVLTPAVAAVVRAARVERPMPFLFACAFVANAASFVLPISNPANLVVYGAQLPTVTAWLSRYALASLAAIGVTYLALRVIEREALHQPFDGQPELPPLATRGRIAAGGVVVAAVALMIASALGRPLGAPACGVGIATAALVLAMRRGGVVTLLRATSWSVLPLVAGLFVLVEGLDRTGVLRSLGGVLQALTSRSPTEAAYAGGVAIALASNLVNNLPAGLVAGATLAATHAPPVVTSAVLVGVDLGPNLSVTGSLATILWLAALRREGLRVSAWQFLRLGACVMPIALAVALLALVVSGG